MALLFHVHMFFNVSTTRASLISIYLMKFQIIIRNYLRNLTQNLSSLSWIWNLFHSAIAIPLDPPLSYSSTQSGPIWPLIPPLLILLLNSKPIFHHQEWVAVTVVREMAIQVMNAPPFLGPLVCWDLILHAHLHNWRLLSEPR